MKASNIISINVGGKIFQTTPDTLAISPVLVAQHNNIGDDETLFLDKDPKIFRFVLELMRGDSEFDDIPYRYKRKVINFIDFLLMRNVIQDVKFFRIENPNSNEGDLINMISVSSYHSDQTYFNVKAGDRVAKIMLKIDQFCKGMIVRLTVQCENKIIFIFERIPQTPNPTFEVNLEFVQNTELLLKHTGSRDAADHYSSPIQFSSVSLLMYPSN